MRPTALADISTDRVDGQAIFERLSFDGPSGRLCGELAYPSIGQPRFAALLVGPHPFMGGTMDNPLMKHVASALAEAGGVALRFDYGGTGGSEGRPIDVGDSMSAFWKTGHAPDDPDRILDVSAAREFLASLNIWPAVLVGYSFGCFAALSGWAGSAPQAAVLISPTVARHDFRSLTGWATPLLIVHSDNDFATPARAVEQWVETLPEPKQRCCIDGRDHFFRNTEHRVAQLCSRFICDALHRQDSAKVMG